MEYGILQDKHNLSGFPEHSLMCNALYLKMHIHSQFEGAFKTRKQSL